MTNRVLIYSIGASLAAHLVVISLVGSTSGFGLNTASAERIPEMIRVELVRDPNEEPKPRQPRIEPPLHKQQVVSQEPKIPELPRTAAPPPRKPASEPAATPRVIQQAPASAASVPGNPGGKLNVGSTSVRGDLPGNWQGGRTPVGWVPGRDTGAGAGSGSGRGIGTPDPPARADSGPGTRPVPAPPPPPPPPPAPPEPKMISLRVCSESGMLPGKHCRETVTRTFVEGRQPDSICTRCRAPEPVHNSTLADRANPLLVKDTKVDASAFEEGIDVTVQVEYTVTAEGDVEGVRVVKSSGNRAVDRAVVNAASGLKYKPAVQNGVPRSVKMTRTYRIRT